MKKRIYEKPATCTIALRHQQHLLAGSSQESPRPTASFMSNPGIDDTEE